MEQGKSRLESLDETRLSCVHDFHRMGLGRSIHSYAGQAQANF